MRASIAGLAIPLLAGCGLFGGNEPEEPPLGCPPVFALIGADRVSSYLTSERKADELRFFAAVNRVRSRCQAVGDDALEVAVAFDLVAERGPALDTDRLQLAYFIAALDPAGDMVGKQVQTIELSFGGKQTTGAAELLTLRFSGLDPDAQPSRRLLVGFEGGAS